MAHLLPAHHHPARNRLRRKSGTIIAETAEQIEAVIDGAVEEIVETSKALEESSEKTVGVLDRFDAWVGANINGPLWTYSLGVPIAKTTTQMVYEGGQADAVSKALEPVALLSGKMAMKMIATTYRKFSSKHPI